MVKALGLGYISILVGFLHWLRAELTCQKMLCFHVLARKWKRRLLNGFWFSLAAQERLHVCEGIPKYKKVVFGEYS